MRPVFSKRHGAEAQRHTIGALSLAVLLTVLAVQVFRLLGLHGTGCQRRVYRAAPHPEYADGVTAGAASGCHVFEFKHKDSLAFQHSAHDVDNHHSREREPGRGRHYHELQVWVDGGGKYVRSIVPDACSAELRRQGFAGPPLLDVVKGYWRGAHLSDKCVRLKGTWLLLPPRAGEENLNLYDRFATEWYHIWLALRTLYPGGRGDVRITHMNGNRGGAEHPFLPVYRLLGQYRQWEELPLEQGCLEFEEAIDLTPTWVFMATPLPSYQDAALQGFADGLLRTLGLGEVAPDPCRPRLLWATRGGERSLAARLVLNEPEVLAAARASLPGWEVQSEELGKLPVEAAIKTVRQAAIYAFPHGGAGPHVLWLHRGAVVLELFPHRMADPMYRNLAVLTGKVYLSWQAQAFSQASRPDVSGGAYTPDRYQFSPVSNFQVDAAAVGRLAEAAALVVRGSLGAGWAPVNAPRFALDLAHWHNETLAQNPGCPPP